MATDPQFRLNCKSRDSYLDLILNLPLASIKSSAHLAEAQRAIDRLLARGSLDEGGETYLETLSDLVAAYEDEHHAIEPASDADMLQHFLESQGISQSQLAKGTGIPKSTISQVLAGKRPFSRQMIRKLANYFKVDVGVLTANF